MRAAVYVEHGASVVKFVLVTLDVRPGTVGQLFFAGKEYETDRMLWPDAQALENSRRFENDCHPSAVIVRALCRIPIVKMRSQQYFFARVFSRKISNDVAFCSRTSAEAVLCVDLHPDRPF